MRTSNSYLNPASTEAPGIYTIELVHGGATLGTAKLVVKR